MQVLDAVAPRAGNPTLARVVELLPGLALSAGVAGIAIELDRTGLLASHGLSALTIAIIFGIALGNTAYSKVARQCGAGVAFSKQTLLRLGIILYGFRLTFQDVGHVGLAGVAIDALVISSTFLLTVFLGTRLFKLDRHTSILIGAGSSICGAAAVMATEPVVRGRADQVTVAISTVVVCGTIAIFIYPLLYQFNLHWHLLDTSSSTFGLYTGSTVHEVAQVVAAARSIDQEAANTAVIAKMVRVMMLAPFLIILSAYLARDKAVAGNNSTIAAKSPARVAIPWFAIGFVAVVGLNSLAIVHPALAAMLVEIDTWLLAIAMGALGLTTHLSAIRKAGIKPLLLAMILLCWLVGGGWAINRIVMALVA